MGNIDKAQLEDQQQYNNVDSMLLCFWELRASKYKILQDLIFHPSRI